MQPMAFTPESLRSPNTCSICGLWKDKTICTKFNLVMPADGKCMEWVPILLDSTPTEDIK